MCAHYIEETASHPFLIGAEKISPREEKQRCVVHGKKKEEICTNL
jgi:hypothetical protein